MHKIYAQIVNGAVHALFSVPAGVDNFGAGVEMVDVTGFDPRPEPGWLYRPGEDVLFVPPEPTVDPDPPAPAELVKKTRYTHREFILRLGDEYPKIERLRDENNAKPPHEKNYDLARLFRLYDEAEFIALNDPSLQQAMQAFVTLGLVTQERATEILTPDEVE